MKTKQCPHCPMVFVETKNLTRHLKTHTLEKPYVAHFFHIFFCYTHAVAYFLFIFSDTHVQFVVVDLHTATMYGRMSKRTPIEMSIENSNAP